MLVKTTKVKSLRGDRIEILESLSGYWPLKGEVSR